MKAISKLLALVLVAAMMVTCAACAKTPASSAAPSETPSAAPSSAQPSLFNVGKLPIVNEPVTLNILTQDDVGRPFDTADKAGLWAWLTEKNGHHAQNRVLFR